MERIKGNSEVCKVAEMFNQEYLEYRRSKPCKTGEIIYQYYKSIKKCQINKILFDLKNRLVRKLLKSKYYFPIQNTDCKKYDSGNLDELVKTKRIVVYSCVTDNYDCIQEPLFEFDGADFVMFSDNSQIINPQSVWKIYDIPEKLAGLSDSAKNRYIKLHPFEFFEEYDYALYIDGNVKVISHPLFFSISSEKGKTGIAMHNHRSRSCIYKEAAACKLLKRGNIKKIQAQIEKYKAEGFPSNWGLFEANVIVINLKNPNAKEVMDSWWEELSRSGGGRDQIVLPYVLWKLGYQSKDIGFLGNDVTQNPKLRVMNHIK